MLNPTKKLLAYARLRLALRLVLAGGGWRYRFGWHDANLDPSKILPA